MVQFSVRVANEIGRHRLVRHFSDPRHFSGVHLVFGVKVQPLLSCVLQFLSVEIIEPVHCVFVREIHHVMYLKTFLVQKFQERKRTQRRCSRSECRSGPPSCCRFPFISATTGSISRYFFTRLILFVNISIVACESIDSESGIIFATPSYLLWELSWYIGKVCSEVAPGPVNK